MKRTLSALLSVIMAMSIVLSGFNVLALDVSKGIDVSEWNSSVNYENVKKNGKSFVMIRLGYYNHLDKYFWENVKKASDAGMNFGVYLYSYAYTTEEADIEADFVIDTLSQLGKYYKNFTLPVAYDMEDSSMTRLGKSQLTKQMTTFCDKIRNAGYAPMVYANQNWFLNYIDLNTVVSKDYKIWYAYYPNTKPSSFTTQIEIGNTGVKADMWQYFGVNTASPTMFDENVIYYTDKLVKNLSCYHKYTLDTATKATADKDGLMIRTCSACKKSVKSVIPKATVTLSKTSYTYTGKVQVPTVTVKNTQGNELVLGKDYEITYQNKSSTKAGAYNIRVDFIGDRYDGFKIVTYKINPLSNSTAKLNTNVFTINGKAQKPTVTATDSKGNKLANGIDYTVTYSNANSTNVGRYTVTVKYIGDYSGNASQTFPYYINPKPTTFLSSAQGGFKAVKNGFTLTWNKQTSQTTGYQLQYATKRDFSNAASVWIENNTTTTKTITGRAGNTRYYVRLRPYTKIGTGTFYGNWDYEGNYIKSVVTLSASSQIGKPTAKLNTNVFTTNGKAQKPTVTATDSKGNKLANGIDYTVTYSNANSTNVGRYTVTVKYIGDYSGNASQTFPYYINPKPTTFLSSAQGGFKAVKNGFTLTWNKQTSQTTGYQLQYATKRDFSNAASVWIENNTTTTKTITGRAGNTRYYVRLRPYTKIGTGTFYGNWDYEGNYVKSIVTLK